ncbi:hypothetical protein BKA64DRAFT_328540 [Cadophora sp. MPI-SDFR-AT-0126]|nr:hypothetical protein BKA64DRAFT_328540 [Leotiomycetes sp. MPI-SDFR-AT-0126]
MAVTRVQNTSSRSQIGSPLRPPRSKTKRSQWTACGCNIYGWPSIGGMIMRASCDLVELRYLGFDPLNVPTTRFENQEDEDDFCRCLKRIGGKWWRSEQRRLDVTFAKWRLGERPNREEMREVYVGWPEAGGVLVLEGDESEMTVETGKLRMVTDMEARCHVLRHTLAAVFYEDPDSYAGFDGLGPRKTSHDEEESEEDAEEDDGHDEKATAGQDHGRQGWDGKCVCS